MKNLYKVSCVLIALMFVSVSCFAALGPGDSKDTSDTATVLSSASEKDVYLDQMEQEYLYALENKAYITISVPVYDSTTGTYSTTDFDEIPVFLEPMSAGSVDFSEYDVITEKFKYLAYYNITTPNIVEHYDGYYVYLSPRAIAILAAGGGLGSLVLGPLGIPTVVASLISGLFTVGGLIGSLEYPDGVLVAVATGIYLTKTIVIPMPNVLYIEAL